MPGIDGVEATREIMRRSPCPVLVVTASVRGNVGKVYEALGYGALDAVATPRLGLAGGLEGAAELVRKIATVQRRWPASARRCSGPRRGATRDDRAGGASGRAAAGRDRRVDRRAARAGHACSARCPPTCRRRSRWCSTSTACSPPGLARWLARRSRPLGRAAADAEPLRAGHVWLAAGRGTSRPARRPAPRAHRAEPADCLHCPSIDVFFDSVARRLPGARLRRAAHRHGPRRRARPARACAAPAATPSPRTSARSVVWGMPRAAVESGGATEVLPHRAASRRASSTQVDTSCGDDEGHHRGDAQPQSARSGPRSPHRFAHCAPHSAAPRLRDRTCRDRRSCRMTHPLQPHRARPARARHRRAADRRSAHRRRGGAPHARRRARHRPAPREPTRRRRWRAPRRCSRR